MSAPTINYALLARQLIEYVKAKGRLGQVPRPDPNNSFGIAVHTLNTAVKTGNPDGTVPVNLIEALLKEVEQVMQEPHVQAHVLDPVNVLADAIATKAKSSFGALTAYHRIVDESSKRIHSRCDVLIAADPILREPTSTAQPPAYEIFSWEPLFRLPALSENAVVEMVHKVYGRENGMPDLQIAKSYREAMLTKVAKEASDVALPADALAAILAKAKAAAGANPDEKGIACLVEFILNLKTKLVPFVAALTAYAFYPAGKHTMDMAERTLAYFGTIEKAWSALSLNVYDVNAETLDKIKVNIECFSMMLASLAYIVTYYRHNLFKDTVLLPNMKMNADNVDTYKALSGIHEMTLRDHVSVVYHTVPLADTISGVTLTEVEKQREAVAKRIESLRAAATTHRVLGFAAAQRRAIIAELQDMYQKPPEGLKAIADRDFTRLAEVLAQRVVASNADPKMAVYEFLFKAFEVNPFAVVLYNALGAEYTRVLTTSKNVDEQYLRVMEVSVLQRLIFDFIRNLLCTPK